jgi:predicted RNA-binding protein associated with RNAse of E/G family
MRKKDILGHFIRRKEIVCSHTIKKVADEECAYSAFIKFLPGCKEFNFKSGDIQIQLAGNGCKWLMYLPLYENWCLTAFYDPENRIQEWYFDISKGNFLDENGVPCTDDIFLDLVVLPDGRTKTVDADELREALDDNVITMDDYNHAYRVHDEILASKWNDVPMLTAFSDKLVSEFD